MPSPSRVPLLAALALVACAAPPDPAPRAAETPAAELFAQAEVLFRAREYARAGEAFQLVAHEADRQRDERVTVEACALAARCYSIGGDLAQGRLWLDRALGRATRDEPLGWSRTQQVVGIFQREDGEREAALETFETLFAYCRARGLERRAVDAAHHAALVAEPEGQVTWAERGLEAARRGGDERWQAILWNNLGRTYETLGRYEDMLAAYRQARVFHGRTGGEHEVLLADWAVGRGLRLSGRPAEAEAQLEEVLLRARARQAREPKPGHLEWVGYTLWELGEVAATGDRPVLARERLNAALDTLTRAGLEAVWPEGLDQIRARLADLAGGG